MNVLTRNYFRMLRNGAFGENEPMEPMSKYKWEALYRRAEREEVLSYIKDDAPHISINFEDHTQGRKFRSIAKAEYHAIDTSLDTLDMLNIMLYNIDQTISGHTSLHGIIEMGRFLRKKGDKVDSFEGANNAIGTLVLRFQTKEALEHAITHQRDWLKVVVR